jgi:hypothetical protein
MWVRPGGWWQLNADLLRYALLTDPSRVMSKAEVEAAERLADTAAKVCGQPMRKSEADDPVMLKEMNPVRCLPSQLVLEWADYTVT